MRRRSWTGPVAVLISVALLASCTSGEDGETTPGDQTASPGGDVFALPDDVVLAGALAGFEECEELEAYVKEAALELVTPWGLGGGGWGPIAGSFRAGAEMADDDAADSPASSAADGAVGSSADGAVGSSDTGTNVQEAGVDEPDRVKTDGTHLYLVGDGALRIVDVTEDQPVEVGHLELRDAYDAQLLLADDRLLVTSSAPRAIPFAGEPARSDSAADSDIAFPGGGWSGTTTLTTVDVADPASPVVLERLTVDGTTLSARLIDGVARVVVRMEQGDLPWAHPETSGLRAERRALDTNRQIIRDSEVEDWLPYAVHETADGQVNEGLLLACEHLSRPEMFSGLGVLSILTVDVADGGLSLDRERGIGVLAGGDTVYASPDALYVATTRWIDWDRIDRDDARPERAPQTTTEIHRFDLDDPDRARYVASGEVQGTLLSQWAMSEHDGVLRVASTKGDPWDMAGEPSESLVTTLEPRDGELLELGQVDGLGLTERIYAVRFIDDTGYVVTFRQTDPLYTIDLSDPRDPRMTGELKILGYSAYLHPIGNDLLLGIGQDADDQGRIKGTQLSLFDVSDPQAPTELDKVVLTDSHSDAEHDHRAFMHHPASGLTVVPFTRWSFDERSGREDVDTGALAFAARDGAIQQRGRITHLPAWLEDLRTDLQDRDPEAFDEDDWRDQERLWEWGYRGRISRSLVVDDRLLTISELGIGVHDLQGPDDIGWLGFDR